MSDQAVTRKPADVSDKSRRILVTGGAGFIGSALVRHLIANRRYEVFNVDKLTYAGNLQSLGSVVAHPRYRFRQADICDAGAMRAVLSEFRPEIVTHLAAETHVDRSIDGPADFIQTNIVGTYTLLSEVLSYWQKLGPAERGTFRFHHISTDEVFGSLGEEGHFSEVTAYDPRSPYSASKASSDHLVRAWHHTFGLPVLLTNCSNNYGPYQFPEKLIPLMIIKCLKGEPLPVYGNGSNIRDWLFVDDHVKALERVFEKGEVGQTYVIGGRAEKKNIDVVQQVCDCMDQIKPRPDGRSYRDQIAFVDDRPGHDQRYAIDPKRLEQDLGWKPEESFETGIAATVRWYLKNEAWWRNCADGSGKRLGLAQSVG